jgi:hypothetical protein
MDNSNLWEKPQIYQRRGALEESVLVPKNSSDGEIPTRVIISQGDLIKKVEVIDENGEIQKTKRFFREKSFNDYLMNELSNLETT